MNIAEKLWDLANAITGFSVLQSLATIFALGKGDFKASIQGKREHWLAFVFSLLFAGLYALAIYFCGNAGKSHLATADQCIWQLVIYGRFAAIFFFTLILWFVLAAHYRGQTDQLGERVRNGEKGQRQQPS